MKKKETGSAIIVTLENKCYTWNGNRWYGPDFIQPPAVIISQLNEFTKTKSEAVDVAPPVKRFPKPKKTIKKATPKKKAVNKVVRKVKKNSGTTGRKSTKKNLTKATKQRQTSKVNSKKGNKPLKTKKVQAKKVKSKK